MAEPSPPSVVVEPEDDAAEEPPPPPPPSFPPYPPYAVEPAPATLADTIMAGRDIRVYHKAGLPRKPARPAPRPARPRGPKATDVKMSQRATRAHARCLRRHNAVLTDRLEHMSKPHKRKIICLWREHGDMLPADTIARLRTMLDADEPFKPDQAYEYFINLKKTKKMNKAMRVNQLKKDVMAMCADKRFVWARNATVAFARGIQQRLARPGRYALADGMLRLSNIILNQICCYMHTRPPSRRCAHPKAKFMMEMADKVAIWIDEILSESDDRMLMMDFDEDEEVKQSYEDDERPPPPPPEVYEPTPDDSGPSSVDATTPASEPGTPAPITPAPGTPGSSKTQLPKNVMNADEYGDAEGFADDFLDMMGGAGDSAIDEPDISPTQKNICSLEIATKTIEKPRPSPTAPT